MKKLSSSFANISFKLNVDAPAFVPASVMISKPPIVFLPACESDDRLSGGGALPPPGLVIP